MLRRVSAERETSIAALVRDAVDDWLRALEDRPIEADEWAARFKALLDRRRSAARPRREGRVEQDVTAAVRQVREPRAARRR